MCIVPIHGLWYKLFQTTLNKQHIIWTLLPKQGLVIGEA